MKKNILLLAVYREVYQCQLCTKLWRKIRKWKCYSHYNRV